MTDNSGSSAFGQTLQFITTLKLTELERQRKSFTEHVDSVLQSAKSAPDNISRVEILLKGIKGWSGLSGPTSSSLSLKNIELWLHQAKHDPCGVSGEQVNEWGNILETDLTSAVERYNYAKLFGNLLTEWLRSGDSHTTGSASAEAAEDGMVQDTKSVRAEMLEQKAMIQDVIFKEQPIDKAPIEEYLSSLFSDNDAETALFSLRSRLGAFGKELRTAKVDSAELESWLIKSLLSRDLLSVEKTATLKSFLDNPVILEEVASVLNMQLASLDSWEWPEEGTPVEIRRHLSGKYRAYMDAEIITALLFQYLGMKWSVAFKGAFRSVVNSRAWKRDIHDFSRLERLRRNQCFGESNADTVAPNSIEAERRAKQQGMFFMTQLPGTLEAEDAYDDEPQPGVKANQSVNAQQNLLKIVNTETYLQRALHGQCTVLRADLELFGPSLSHDSVLTALRFYGMPEDWLLFFKKWLNASLKFDANLPPQIRKRGVPIAHTLSVLCGEALLFGIDFAVNQRASGCYLYRIYDDFWFFHRDPDVCVAAWREMQKYASLVGIRFNMKKTGAVTIGGELHPSLPTSPAGCQWGFLKLDAAQGRFIIDQDTVNIHISELRRQLASTKSVFGFVNAYNKYIAFLGRQFGDPVQCFGRIHADEIIDTFNRIQKELFPDTSGSVVKRLQNMIETRFGITNIPVGWFFFPISCGGLEVQNPVIDLLAVRQDLMESPENSFTRRMKLDLENYVDYKERWQTKASTLASVEEFMTFEEYILGRETRIYLWGATYRSLQELPKSTQVELSTRVESELPSGRSRLLPTSDRWQFAMYANQILARFGTLTIVEPSLIPVGMVSVFRSSKISWDS